MKHEDFVFVNCMPNIAIVRTYMLVWVIHVAVYGPPSVHSLHTAMSHTSSNKSLGCIYFTKSTLEPNPIFSHLGKGTQIITHAQVSHYLGRSVLDSSIFGFMHEIWKTPTANMKYTRSQNNNNYGGWRTWTTNIKSESYYVVAFAIVGLWIWSPQVHIHYSFWSIDLSKHS